MKPISLPGWIAEERTLLAYLASPHPGHTYAEDLIDAVALVTGWIIVVVSVLAVLGVLLDGALA